MLLLELALEKESDQHLNNYRPGGEGSGSHGKGYQGSRPGQGTTPEHAHARIMENVKELFWCDARDEQGHLQHAPDCEHRDCFVVQGKQQEKNTGAKAKLPDHYRCTITCAFCGKRKHYEDELYHKQRLSAKLRGEDPGKGGGKGKVEDEEKKRAKKCVAVRFMASEDTHAGIMEFFRQNLGEPSRMLGLKNAVYVEVFGDTMGQRLMRLNNAEWRRGDPLRMQVIFARMSLDEIVKYITVELKLNAKNEAHVQDRQGHGHRGHREDRQHREVKEDTVGTAEEGSGSGQDLWTATTRGDHEEAHFFAFVAYNMKEHGQDRSRWNRLDPGFNKNRKEPRRIGNSSLLFREYRSQHDGCGVCYGKRNNHAHDHRHCKVYEADKKAYFAAHPDKKNVF